MKTKKRVILVRFSVGLLVGMIFIMGFGTIAYSENTNSNDMSFLFSDPDGDWIETWMEYVLGTDPYNSDSDNDGLPDGWEYEYELDPADSSDAHLDYDYYPMDNFTQGEYESNFNAIEGEVFVWPVNTEIKFTDLVFNENSIHYDNYEEYYRPYYDRDDKFKLKIIHTFPNNPDSDDDQLLDPEDPEPLKYNDFKNDSVAMDQTNECDQNQAPKIDKSNNRITNVENDYNDIELIEIYTEISENKFDIKIEQTESNQQLLVNDAEYFADLDNDGILF
jgi:hypothetical protein